MKAQAQMYYSIVNPDVMEMWEERLQIQCLFRR